MELILKIAGVAIVTAISALALRRYVPEFSLVLIIGGIAAVILLGATAFQSAMRFVEALAQFSGMEPPLLTPLLKVLGVSVITKITADICRDSGSAGLAGSTELIGSVLAIICAIPLLSSMLRFVSSF